MADSVEELKASLVAFRDERDWAQFHSLKNLVAALAVEAGELLELTLWKTEEQVDAMAASDDGLAFRNECADVLAYLVLTAERAGFDLLAATNEKIILNAQKYPVDRAKGSATKYNRL